MRVASKIPKTKEIWEFWMTIANVELIIPLLLLFQIEGVKLTFFRDLYLPIDQEVAGNCVVRGD
jgi:hypothetical protein